MSNTGITAKEFVDTVMRIYPPYQWEPEQEAEFGARGMRALAEFSETVRAKALDHLVNTRKDRRLPLVPEMVEACTQTRRWFEKDKQVQTLPIDPPEITDYKARSEFADTLIKSPLGLQATREGWIGPLHSYAKNNRRLPITPGEITQCKRIAKEFLEDVYPRCVRAVASVEAPAALPIPQTVARWVNFEDWGAAILRRWEQKRVMVLRHFGERV